MIQRIDHIGIAVVSIAAARAFYEAMGLVVEAIEEVPQEGVRVAMIACGESKIELLEATSPDSPIARFLEKRGPGIHHLCFASDDLHHDDLMLRDRGGRAPAPGADSGSGRVLGAVRPPEERRRSPRRALAGGRRVTIRRGALVLVHLVNPTEKFWGTLDRLETVGVTFRGISLDSFEVWVTELARRESSGLGLATMFVPLFRVERIFLDEEVGEVESYRRRFERRVGASVDNFVTLERESDEADAPESDRHRKRFLAPARTRRSRRRRSAGRRGRRRCLRPGRASA